MDATAQAQIGNLIQVLGQINSSILATFPNWQDVPASSSAAGTAGDIAYSSTFLYVCVSANSWRRVALSTF